MAKNRSNKTQILLMCCLVYGNIVGLIVNCSGQFYQPIAESLGVAIGDVTLGSTIMGVFSFVCTPFVVKLYQTHNIKIVAGAFYTLYCLGNLFSGLVTSLWQYYVCNAMRGAGQGLLIYYLVSTIIKAWYPQNSGRPLGISALFGGIMGIIANTATGYGMDLMGWRATMIVTSLIALVVGLPLILLYLERPAGNASPAPESEEKRKEKKKEKSIRSMPGGLRVYCAGLGMVMFLGLPFSCSQNLKIHAMSLGFPQMAAAMLLTLTMVGNIGFKLLLGVVSDKLGPKNCARMMLIFMMVGYVFVLLPTNYVFLCIGALCLGGGATFTPIIVPQVVSYTYRDDFEQIYASFSMVLSLSGSILLSLVGIYYSATGSYRGLFVIGIGIIILTLFLLEYFTEAGRQGAE